MKVLGVLKGEQVRILGVLKGRQVRVLEVLTKAVGEGEAVRVAAHRISAANLPHGRCRTPRYLNVPLFFADTCRAGGVALPTLVAGAAGRLWAVGVLLRDDVLHTVARHKHASANHQGQPPVMRPPTIMRLR